MGAVQLSADTALAHSRIAADCALLDHCRPRNDGMLLGDGQLLDFAVRLLPSLLRYVRTGRTMDAVAELGIVVVAAGCAKQ